MHASGVIDPSETVPPKPAARASSLVDCLLLPFSWSLFPPPWVASVLKKPPKFLLLFRAVVVITGSDSRRSPWLRHFTSVIVEPVVLTSNVTLNDDPEPGVV